MFVFIEIFSKWQAEHYINKHTLCSGATEAQVEEKLEVAKGFESAQEACVFLGKFVYEYSDVDEFINVEEAIEEVWDNCVRRTVVVAM